MYLSEVMTGKIKRRTYSPFWRGPCILKKDKYWAGKEAAGKDKTGT